jgi:hypothetical protein
MAKSKDSVETIYELFLAPLIQFKPQNITLREWWEFIFDVHNRGIERVRVVKAFKMPGLYYTSSSVKVQGVGYRQVRKGDELMVRFNDRAPDEIDVEWFGGPGKRDNVFALNATQWRWVERHCSPIKRRNRILRSW